ncbi:MAG: cytochrome b [Burkholderiaceae bacterium]
MSAALRPVAVVRYDRVAMALHWIIAVGVLSQIALGWWMIDIPKQPPGVRAYWFNVHKSIGITLGVLIVLRLSWRLTHRPPDLPASAAAWQARAARASHALLYVCMLAMPLAGYFGSVFSGYPIKYFGVTLPAWGWKDEALKDLFSAMHFTAALVFMLLIAVHVLAALKHWLIDRDGVFHRMLPHGRSAPP